MIETKACTSCHNHLILSQFFKCSKHKDGLSYRCKDCASAYDRRYYLRNSEKIRNRIKDKYSQNPEYFRIKSKQFRKEHPEKIQSWITDYHQRNPNKRAEWNLYSRTKRKNDPLKRLAHLISCNIRNSMKNIAFKKQAKATDILGCNIAEFKQYLESKWESWMNWSNYGLYNGMERFGWDLDHIIPISLAATKEEALALNYYTNFQPLCSKLNRDVKKNRP